MKGLERNDSTLVKDKNNTTNVNNFLVLYLAKSYDLAIFF